MNKKISVVLPVFNAEKYIRDTIESVMAQTYKNFELIIVDDCSNDGTYSILKEYIENPKIKVVRLNCNTGGPAAPRNHGVGISTGDYIAFIDADDLWVEQKLEIQIKCALIFDVYFVCAEYVLIGEEVKYPDFIKSAASKISSIDIHTPKKFINYAGLLIDNSVCNSSVLVRADALKYYLFEVGKSFVAVEDYIMWLRLHKKHGKSLKIKYKLVGYRIVDSSISRNKFNMVFKRYDALNLLINNKFAAFLLLLFYIFGALFKHIMLRLKYVFHR